MSELTQRLARLTPEQLALLQQKKQQKNSVATGAGGIQRRIGQVPVPMTAGQRRLWFMQQLQGAATAYNMAGACLLTGQLQVTALQQALSDVVQQHEILRTRFVQDQQGFWQHIEAHSNVGLTIVTCPEELTAAAQQSWITRQWQQCSSHVFDLDCAGVWTLTLLILDSDRHVLLMNMHHIISDAWSQGLFTRALLQAYQARIAGTVLPLRTEQLQFADYALWAEQPAQQQKQQQDLAYWTEVLHNCPAELVLPVDHHPTTQLSFRGKTATFQLESNRVQALHSFCRTEQKTPFMLLLALLNLYFGRMARTEDLVIGTSVANRTTAGCEDVLGFFANTLPLRVRQDQQQGFRELLQRCAQVTLAAQSHQQVAFEQLLAAVIPDRQGQQNTLFRVMLVLDNTPAVPTELAGLTLTPLEFQLETAKFDLTFYVELSATSAQLRIQYRQDLFEAATIDAMYQQFICLFDAALVAPEQALNTLPMLTVAEQQHLTRPSAWTRQPPAELSLPQLFEACASRFASRVAVRFEQQQYTYAELNSVANQLAHWLVAQGCQPGDRIGLCFTRGPEMIMAMLATVKAGAVYVPLDPDAPEKRKAFIVEDAGLHLLLVHQSVWPQQAEQVFSWEQLSTELATYPATDLLTTPDPAQPAYMIYTSGSTGQPKGVMVSHANLTGLFVAAQRWYQFDQHDVWSVFHSFAFDFSVWEIWGALLHGGCALVVPYHTSRSPQAFYQLLQDQQVTVLNQTPTAFKLLSLYEEAAAPAEKLALRYIVFGGETLNFSDLIPWFRRHGDQQPALFNMFGITETTVHVTCRPVHLSDCFQDDSLLGDALPDMQCYVLDDALQPLPVGVPGELYVSGRGVSQGYWRRPELTASRFIDSPFGPEKLYRTGDLARWNRQGELVYQGRIDHQVQLRGFRIELGEIDFVLGQHPQIKAARSRICQTGHGPQLVAYLVADSELQLTGLNDFLRDYLPPYMIPAGYQLLESLPLTINGKLDVDALPVLELVTSQRQFVAPEGETEQQLAVLWQQLLQLSQVGREDNFFALGGDSIKSILLVNKAKEAGLQLSVEDVLISPSLSVMAGKISRQVGAATSVLQPVSPFALLEPAMRNRLPAGVTDAYPLSALQQGMLFHAGMEQHLALYHNSASTTIVGSIDVERFRSALHQVMARHPMLRTSLLQEPGLPPLQLVYAELPVPLQVDDLQHLTAEQQATALTRIRQQELQHKFVLEQAPLLRLRVVLLAPELFELVWTEHHAIMDGWSVSCFFAELIHYYLQGENATPLPLPQLGYADFIRAELSAVADPVQQQYWRQTVSGRQASQLLPWPGQTDPAVFELTRPLPADWINGLNQLTIQYRVSLKTLLLAIHVAVIQRLTGQSQVMLGYSSHGRPTVTGADQLIGLFVSMLPLVVNTAAGQWQQLLSQTEQAEQQLNLHRLFPLSAIQHLTGQRDLLDCCFNYIHFPETPQQADSQFRQLDRLQHQRNSFALSTTFNVKGAQREQLSISIEYDAARYPAAQIQAVYQLYLQAVQSLLQDNLQQFRATVPAAALRQLQHYQADYRTPDQTFYQLFEQQVAAQPTATALIWQEQQLSYQQLNVRANQLAHTLMSRYGLQRGTVAGICLPRGPDTVVSLLAIAKCGAAYLPLDPDYPTVRQLWMLQDARPHLVLCYGNTRPAEVPAGTTVVELDLLPTVTAVEHNPQSVAEIQDLACLIYTSGSTGQPKGVMIEHRSISRLVQRPGYVPLNRQTRMLQAASLNFDAATLEIWGPLCNGGVVVMYPDSGLDLQILNQQLAEHQVNTLWLTAGLFEQWSQHCPALPELKYVLAGGDVLNPSAVRRTCASLPAVTVINGYGPTENTTFSCCYEIPAGHAADQAVPIGYPVPGTQVRIVDGLGFPLGPGVIGELWLAGDGLARGYWQQQSLTEERFVIEAGHRWYKTGDLVRQLPDGVLAFHGRRDRQVKINGYRIELDEVEIALNSLAGVIHAAVLATGKPAQLHAFVATELQQAEPLKAQLRQLLPAYQIPSVFTLLTQLPLTDNGKVDRKALASLEVQPTAVFVEPATETEQILCQLLATLLQRERVGRTDNFFTLGGHSLIATRFCLEISKEFGVSLPVRQLFELPVVHQLAEQLDFLRLMQTETDRGDERPQTARLLEDLEW
jgi:tyrocidine synthetase-3